MTNTKTPAMLLQEYTVKKKISPPEYNLIVSKSGTHENEFHYKVNVAGISAIGIGRSKQVAKHNAAFSALEILNKMGYYDIGEPAPNFTPNLHRNEPDNPNEGCVNSIGCLQELCMENKIPLPIFHEISDVGPPHCRQFTYECEISSIKTQAIAKTKKQAKQLSARFMLEKIKDMIPDLVKDTDDLDNALLEDDKALKEYHRLHKVISNKSAKIIDYSSCFTILMTDLELSKNDIIKMLDEQTDEQLEKLLEKFKLQYEYIKIQEEPRVIVVLDINLDTPFTVIGTGSKEEDAKREVLLRTFKTLSAYINVAECDNHAV